MCILKKLKDTKLHSDTKYIEGLFSLNKIQLLVHQGNRN